MESRLSTIFSVTKTITIYSQHLIMTSEKPEFNELEISKITNRIYLSSHKASTDLWELQMIGITHILSIYLPAEPLFAGQGINYKIITDILDMPNPRNRNRVLQKLPETNTFIHEALTTSDNSKVLIHCEVGCSRSVTFLVAYLMSVTKKTSHCVISAVRKKRIWANPNPGFRYVLEQFFDNGVGVKKEFDRLGVTLGFKHEINSELFGRKKSCFLE